MYVEIEQTVYRIKRTSTDNRHGNDVSQFRS